MTDAERHLTEGLHDLATEMRTEHVDLAAIKRGSHHGWRTVSIAAAATIAAVTIPVISVVVINHQQSQTPPVTTGSPTGSSATDTESSPPGPPGSTGAGTAYVIGARHPYTSHSGEVSIIDPGSLNVAATVDLGNVPYTVVVAPAGTPDAGTVYVTSLDGPDEQRAFRQGHTVSVIDPGATTVTAAIDVADGAAELAIAPAGTPNAGTLYVSGGHAVSVIDPGATGVATTIPVDGLAGNLAIAPDGTPNAGTVYLLSRDGTLSVIDPNTNTVTGTIDVGSGAENLAIAPAGTPKAGTVYVAAGSSVSVIAPGTTSLATTIDVGTADKLVIAPAGTPKAGTVYVNDYNAGTLSAIDPNTNIVAATFSVESTALAGMEVAPAGAPNAGTVYVGAPHIVTVVRPDGTTSVIQGISPNSMVTTMAIAPSSAPNAGTVYVAGRGSSSNSDIGTVSVIDPVSDSFRAIAVAGSASQVAIAP